MGDAPAALAVWRWSKLGLLFWPFIFGIAVESRCRGMSEVWLSNNVVCKRAWEESMSGQFWTTTAITRASVAATTALQKMRSRRLTRDCHSTSFFSQLETSSFIFSSLPSSASAFSLLRFMRSSRASIFSSWGWNSPSSPICLLISWYMPATSRSNSLNNVDVESARPWKEPMVVFNAVIFSNRL